MKIIYYIEDGELMPGIATAKEVIKIDDHTNILNSDKQIKIENLIELREIERKIIAKSEHLIPENTLRIGPCVGKPAKIICIGLNYRKHAIESSMEIPKHPILFTKYNNSLTDYGSDIVLGKQGKEYDYEVELGVVIGRKCKNVSRNNAKDYILGYCVANDLSCRDLLFKTSQWLLGKSLDCFLPLGKYLVTADEIEDEQNLALSCNVNGELKQSSNTRDMIFSVAEIIEYITTYMTLNPGDILLTGTPEGVIMGGTEKKWLKHGDVVKVEIEKLGYTENKMINEVTSKNFQV